MFGTILRKKVSNDKLANVFINSLFSTIDAGFPVVAEFINDDPAFVKSPSIPANNNYEFALIVIVGNISSIKKNSTKQPAKNKSYHQERSLESSWQSLPLLSHLYWQEQVPFIPIYKK